jgi:transposase
MSISRKPYKAFTKGFKLEASRLMSESNKSAAEIVAELGIRRNMLYIWKEQIGSKGDEAFLSKQVDHLKKIKVKC